MDFIKNDNKLSTEQEESLKEGNKNDGINIIGDIVGEELLVPGGAIISSAVNESIT
jgi:hypothetical protein